MFNLKEFILNNLIEGVKKGVFAKEYASILATNYLLRGILSQDDVQKFNEETTVSEVEETDENSSGIDEIQEESRKNFGY